MHAQSDIADWFYTEFKTNVKPRVL